MSVYKRFNGKKLASSKDPNWSKGKWYIWKRVRGHKTIHKAVPEAQTKEQAETALRKEIEKLYNKRYGIQDDTTTFAEFVDKTYTKYVKQNNVNIGAKEIYIKNLKAFFGKKPLSEITAQDCRDYQYKCQHTKTRTETKRSPSSVNREMSTLSKIFTLACEEGILERNPTQYVKNLKEPPPRKRLLTEAQKEAFWREVEKDKLLWRVVTLAVNLPLRRGQILAIKKEDVDFDRQTLSVIASKGRPPRVVPLNETAMSVLKDLRNETQSGFLFVYPMNANVLPKYRGTQVKDFGKRWRNMLVRAGINEKDGAREDNFHFHDLRTEFTSELIKRNTHPKVIQQLFAHSDMSITDIYTQIVDVSLFNAVQSLDETKAQEVEGVN
jgi:integrase